MSRTLRVEQLQVRDGRGWQEPYDLNARLVGIIGPIDRGKTSMVECVDYLLGRDVRFRGAVHEHVLAVRGRMRIGDETFVLCRQRNRARSVTVSNAGGDLVGRFPIKASEGQQSLSSWLLERLDLDEKFASVRLPGNQTLDFAADLLPYLHIRQEDIDRFVIRSGNGDAARVVVLKLLLHLTNPNLQRVIGSIQEAESEIERNKRKLGTVRQFLADLPETEADSVQRERRRLREAETVAADRVARLREDARQDSGFAERLRAQLREARDGLSTAEERAAAARHRCTEARNKVDELDESLRTLGESVDSEPAGTALPLEHTVCPACAQDLSDRVVDSGHCSVCTRPLPGSARPRERQRLVHARSSAQADLATAEQDAGHAEAAVQDARERVQRRERALDERTRDSVAPYLDVLAEATAELESVRGQMAALERVERQHQLLAERQQVIYELEKKRDEQVGEKHRLESGLQSSADVLSSLDQRFHDIVGKFGLPWASGRARLNPDTLAPVVDEQEFHERGGGARTAVSVAYSLTLLLHALDDPARFHLPTLLIIDSPRKNLGSNDPDQHLAQRIYQQFITYVEDMRRSRDERYGNFQLIIADNSIPDPVRPHFVIHEFATEGFIRDLPNPHGAPRSAQQLELGVAEDDASE